MSCLNQKYQKPLRFRGSHILLWHLVCIWAESRPSLVPKKKHNVRHLVDSILRGTYMNVFCPELYHSWQGIHHEGYGFGTGKKEEDGKKIRLASAAVQDAY